MAEMEIVESSNVEAVGYEADTQELHIRFTSGDTYIYFGVEEWVHQELMQSDSKGSYHNNNIKGVYEFSKL